MTATVEEYAGRWEHPSLPQRPLTAVEARRFAAFCFTCPLCAGQIKHTRREHADMVAAIRHPLLPMLWSDGDDEDLHQVVSRGHHDARRFLAAAHAHTETKGWLSEADGEVEVSWVWWRYRPKARKVDGEWVGLWCETTPGRGAVPFTLAREVDPP